MAWSIAVILGSAGVLHSAESGPGQIGFPLIRAYSAAETVDEATSWSMTSDADGLLYFGCNSLVTFDGERWTKSGISGSYAIRGLDFGKQGRLWAAASGEIGWFSREPQGTWSFHSLLPTLPKSEANVGEVWNVFAQGDGAIFVSAEKVYFWNGSKMLVWALGGTRRLTAMRVGDAVYVHHSITGLYRIDATGPKQLLSSQLIGTAPIVWMEPRDDGWLFVTTKGILALSHGNVVPQSATASEYLRRNWPTAAVRLSDGRLVIGTYEGGIVVLTGAGEIDRIYTEADGLPTSSIFSLGLDRDHDVWAMTASSIVRLGLRSGNSLFDRRSGLAARNAHAVVRVQDRIAAATDDGVFEMTPGSNSFQPVKALPQRAVDLQVDDNALLVANIGAVRQFANGVVTTLRRTPQDVFLTKRSSIFAGQTLVAEGHSIVLLSSDHTARVVVENLPDLATSVAEDNHGRIWVGTAARGILFAQALESHAARAEASNTINPLLTFNGPALVAETPNRGIVLFGSTSGWFLNGGSGRLVSISNYPRAPVGAVSRFSSDGAQWLIHPQFGSNPPMVARISLQGENCVWQPHHVEGLEAIGTPLSIFAENSSRGGTTLWIGGANGILRAEVPNGPVAPKPRAPLLHAFAKPSGSDSLQPVTDALPYSTRSVVFEFAAPQYSLRPSLRLETRIEGIDDQWMPADATSRRELTAMRDGTYQFQVRAVAATGMVSETTHFPFHILPPWWRTPPAIAGALIALLPLGYGVYSLRVRRLRRRNAELEEKVTQRTEQLALASAAKTQFVANMSHDIRNPLNGIVGLTLALEDTPLNSKQKELISTLRECTSYLSTLVDDVLDFASIEAGRVELRPAPFAPAEVLRSVVATLRAEAASLGATLLIETNPALPESIVGDAGRIQQILVNYVSNALKYAGGQIVLAATISPDAAGEIEFSVTDAGAGIVEAEQSTLFTKFHRLAGAQNSTIKGSGLGLASCRLLADLMGGSVGVESKPGHGARFFLRLPVTIAPVSTPAPTTALPNTSVLLVEDADYNAWAAAAVLGKLGLTCERARNGAEALRMFADKRFNLVLLDRNLPDMDGTEVARKMRELEEDGPRAILLAVTAYCTAQDRSLCLAAGMDAFVGKPLTPSKLRKILVTASRRLLTAASVHVSPDATGPTLDVSLLDYISDGSPQGLSDQIERFIASLADAVRRLDDAAHSRDFDTLAESAHFLLSQGKLIGCATLEEAALTLETAARARDGFAFGEMKERLNREVEAVTAAMRRNHPAGQTA